MAIFQAFLSTRAFSSNELQFEFGDSVSIYSEKAYRRDGGKIFEAIGNVIVIVGKDTLYGERVSFNIASGDVVIEGSVRYVGKSITIYGSKINYNLNTEKLVMLNSRMITPEFSIVAAEISKRSEKNYYAKNAEFTTCRDCKESWLISGKDIFLEMDKYAQIHHALIKVKGVDVVYVPYIALPIKNSRESGLLFPNVQVRSDEGAVYEQPFFWAINESQDLTFTPTFATNRGYGFDFEYRKVFGERRWMEFSNKLVFDTIYVPEQPRADSSSQFLRNFYEVENHYQFSNDFGQHLRVTGTKDLDFVRDYSFYTDNLIQETDLGASIYFDKRFEKFNLSLSSDYRRNILISDPNDFDRDYVQSLPSIDLSVAPQMVFQNDSNYFFKMNYAFDGNFTVFKQDELNEEVYLRNTNRFDSSQFLELSILNIGPITMKSKYTLDFQEYRFIDEDQDDFRKHAAILSTEMSFTIDKIFGLAYEEKYNSSEIRDADIVKIRNQAPSKNQSKLKIKKNSSLIGNLPDLESTISQNFITVSKNSYRHSQDFKLIHHRITSQGESGNERFRNQIRTNEGWFDLRDATLGDLQELEANETRRTIPLENTLEFQWNNSLIKKTPKKFNYLVDNNYLKDNFTYSKIGYFNLSQGFLLNSNDDDLKNNLTRLFINTGYNSDSWSFNFSNYYFHSSSNNIGRIIGQKRFNRLSLLSQYDFNSFQDSNLKTLQSGIQFKPFDVFGFSVLQEFDLDANENISTIYQADFMPHNNCWIISLNYRDNLVEQRYAFNFAFNFGDETFQEMRNNFFDFSRIN